MGFTLDQAGGPRQALGMAARQCALSCLQMLLAWQEKHCYDFVTKDKWPPSSPDLNPMDYFFWGILENQTNQRPHTTKASLITSIKEQCISIDREMMKKACGSFRTRIERVIEAEGNYVE